MWRDPPSLLLLLLFSALFYLKGIVSKISNDPLCKDDNARPIYYGITLKIII